MEWRSNAFFYCRVERRRPAQAPDALHIIGSHMLVRHGRTVESQAADEQRQCGQGNIKAEVILATFNLQYYLSEEWRQMQLPLVRLLEWA